MLDALNITEEEALGLAELAQHDLAMARDFARRAQAAEDSEEAGRLARSYHRMARSYRQTLALKARLRRDLAAAARADAQTRPSRPGGAAVARRIDEVRAALLRMAWDEAERPEDEPPEAERPEAEHPDGQPSEAAEPAAAAVEIFAFLREDVEAAVTEDCLADGFGREPLDDHVARLALALGFPLAAIERWRDLRDPPAAALDAEPPDLDWRSSA